MSHSQESSTREAEKEAPLSGSRQPGADTWWESGVLQRHLPFTVAASAIPERRPNVRLRGKGR